MLYIIRESSEEKLQKILEDLSPHQIILFIGESVLLLTKPKATYYQKLSTNDVYVLSPDLSARGMLKNLYFSANLVDYDGFVRLTEEYPVALSF